MCYKQSVDSTLGCVHVLQAERRFNSRLYDLKDRLEQSHATNRSLQNYVQFLKQSYTSAFNDSTLGPPPSTSTPLRAPLY